MFNLLGNKKLNPFGLSVSERTVKVMQLAKHKTVAYPTAFSNLDVPAGLIANHIITNEDKLAAIINKAVSSAGRLNSNYVVVSVPEAKSFVRVVTLPKMEVSEISGALPWELEQDIPVPVDQVYLDWQLIDQNADSMKVLAVASPKDYINSLSAVLKIAKLKPVAYELEPRAAARALITAEDLNSTVMIVDIASNNTTLAVVSKGILEYTSSTPTGGAAITDSLVKNLGLTAPEAEKFKVENGLLLDSKKGNAKQAMLPIIDVIIDEMRGVIKFHEDHSTFNQTATKVILCGGGAKLQGLVDYVSARLNLVAGKAIERIILSDPWINVAPLNERKNFPKIEDSQEYTAAIGLALRGLESDENN